MGRCLLSALFFVIVVSAACISNNAVAQQFDAPYYELQKKHASEWAQEDKAIDAKLAALERKFGKKPNIIYILVDDIGHGELGVQGGGAARGAPTPQLDRMAQYRPASGGKVDLSGRSDP